MMKRWISFLLALVLMGCVFAAAEDAPDEDDSNPVPLEVTEEEDDSNPIPVDMMEDEDLEVDEEINQGRILQYGDHGDDVLALQTRLKDLQYYSGNLSGRYREGTRKAVETFQADFGLDQTGVATESVQRLLFSADAKQSDERVFPYKLYVDVSDQRVYVYKWNGESYEENVKTFVCSTGTKATPTILGTYSCDGKAGEWYYFQKYNCWARYAFRIQGGYLFHSVTFSSQNSLISR